MRKILFICLFFLVNGSFAQAPKAHPIDTWLEHAIHKDPSTAGMRAAINKAQGMWDKEMNQTYTRLMSRLSKEQQTSLREAQRAWLKYRDAEAQAIEVITASKDGTIWQLTATDQGMALVRTRALQLKAYGDTIEE